MVAGLCAGQSKIENARVVSQLVTLFAVCFRVPIVLKNDFLYSEGNILHTI